MTLRVNIGCGPRPTAGWLNFDNSWTVRFAHHPVLARCLSALLSSEKMAYVEFCREHQIGFADATRFIPLPDASVEVLYSSHMLEHLDGVEALSFLAEARRVLAVDGILRVTVPDVAKLCAGYAQHGDADRFMELMLVCEPKPKTLVARCREVMVGRRHHHWMYDGPSLLKLLNSAGFREVILRQPGETAIADPGPLDLFERADESVCAEAVK